MNELDLFAAAIAIAEPTKRDALLDRECSGRPELRKRLEQLLDQHARSQHLLDHHHGMDRNDMTALMADKSLTGTVIAGRYKLLEPIGDGGMGTVWMAEQREPVKRLVAIKLIKPGMDSKAVLARFEAERQALAMMDHPNIAKVHDAGTDENGRPYFVMELVKGLPLTEYCDARKLTVNERLNLFVQICSAVQHAHQKAVIHRDLKPTNVLVTEHDGKPVPKVIDFGLAKALNASQMLTDRTLHTAYGTVVGTPLYMAPEQVGINALDVDTRTDIYALGVILYELLTGTTPLEKARFKEAAWEEVKRLILEEEPPRPSTRLSSVKTLPSLAASRQVDPGQLQRQVQGELDWIVMKALDKDRGRRYETATGLAKDVQRYVAGDAVEACPPTLGYRLRKTFQKHRASILTSGAFVLLLFVGMLVTTYFAINNQRLAMFAEMKTKEEVNARKKMELALRERDLLLKKIDLLLEERDKVLIVFRGVLDEFNRHKHPNATIKEVLVRACNSLDSRTDLKPVMRAKVRLEFGLFFDRLHEYQLAYQQFDKAYREFEQELGRKDDATIGALLRSGVALVDGRQSLEDLQRAEKIITDACERNEEAKGESDKTSVENRMVLSSCLFNQTRFDEVIKLNRMLLKRALENRAIGEAALITANIRYQLANMLSRSTELDDLAEAKVLCEQASATFQRLAQRETKGKEYLEFRIMQTEILLYLTSHLHRNDPSVVRDYDALVDQIFHKYGTSTYAVADIYDGLAIASLEAGELTIAEKTITKLREIAPTIYGRKSPYIRRYDAMWGEYLVQSKQFGAAEKVLEELLSSDEAKEGGFVSSWDSFFLIRANTQYGVCLRQRHEDALALEHFEKALKLLEVRMEQMGTFQNRHMVEERVLILKPLLELYTEIGQPEKAVEAQTAITEMQKILDRIPR